MTPQMVKVIIMMELKFKNINITIFTLEPLPKRPKPSATTTSGDLELISNENPEEMLAENEAKEETVVLKQTQVEVYKTQKAVKENKEVMKPKKAKEIDVQGNSTSKFTFGGFTLENCDVTFNLK